MLSNVRSNYRKRGCKKSDPLPHRKTSDPSDPFGISDAKYYRKSIGRHGEGFF